MIKEFFKKKEGIMHILQSYSELTVIGITIIRIGMGILFIIHGYLKLSKGVDEWKWTGEQMKNIGVTFAPLFWGISAMLAEFLGGICLTLGLFTRLVAPFMAFTMFVAMVYHIRKGDSYGYISFPASQMIVFLGLFFTGSGPYSLDYYMVHSFFKNLW